MITATADEFMIVIAEQTIIIRRQTQELAQAYKKIQELTPKEEKEKKEK